MTEQAQIVDTLAGLTLFADLSMPQLEGVAHTFEEEAVPDEQRVLRQGFSGAGFYVILEGEAAVVIDGVERARLRRGDFFGEVSILLGRAPIADIVAKGPLRTLVLAGPDLPDFLLAHPPVMLRMLQTMARRVAGTSGAREA
jgi:CRP-like cAMP-binding protein